MALPGPSATNQTDREGVMCCRGRYDNCILMFFRRLRFVFLSIFFAFEQRIGRSKTSVHVVLDAHRVYGFYEVCVSMFPAPLEFSSRPLQAGNALHSSY